MRALSLLVCVLLSISLAGRTGATPNLGGRELAKKKNKNTPAPEDNIEIACLNGEKLNKKTGQCVKVTCEAKPCADGLQCVPMKRKCKKKKLPCPQFACKAPGCGCGQLPNPVCGADGEDYLNKCLAQCAGVKISHKGKCKDTCECKDDSDAGPCAPTTRRLTTKELEFAISYNGVSSPGLPDSYGTVLESVEGSDESAASQWLEVKVHDEKTGERLGWILLAVSPELSVEESGEGADVSPAEEALEKCTSGKRRRLNSNTNWAPIRLVRVHDEVLLDDDQFARVDKVRPEHTTGLLQTLTEERLQGMKDKWMAKLEASKKAGDAKDAAVLDSIRATGSVPQNKPSHAINDTSISVACREISEPFVICDDDLFPVAEYDVKIGSHGVVFTPRSGGRKLFDTMVKRPQLPDLTLPNPQPTGRPVPSWNLDFDFWKYQSEHLQPDTKLRAWAKFADLELQSSPRGDRCRAFTLSSSKSGEELCKAMGSEDHFDVHIRGRRAQDRRVSVYQITEAEHLCGDLESGLFDPAVCEQCLSELPADIKDADTVEQCILCRDDDREDQGTDADECVRELVKSAQAGGRRLGFKDTYSWQHWRTFHADHRDKLPDYAQFSHNGCAVGCGPVAWSMMFAWADRIAHTAQDKWCWATNIYTPGTAPSGWQSWNNDLKNFIKTINNEVDTFCSFGYGATTPPDMDDVSPWFRRRNGGYGGVYTKYNIFGYHEDRVRNYASKEIWQHKRPVVIGTGWLAHYPVAQSYRWRKRKVCYGWGLYCKWQYQRQYFVKQGWSNSAHNKWISASTWFAGRIRQGRPYGSCN